MPKNPDDVHEPFQPSAAPWESLEHRFKAPLDLQKLLGGRNETIAVPKNTIDHIQHDHPKDAEILQHLQEFVDMFEWTGTGTGTDDTIVFYSCYGGVWRRGIVVPSRDDSEPNILASVYRRDSRKVTRAIENGALRRRGE